MRYPTSNALIAVVVLLSLLLVLLMEASGFGAFSPLWNRPIIRVICAANLLVALPGLMTRKHVAWLNYLLLSIAAYVVASTTPIAALWVIPKTMFFAVRHAFSSLW
ncbi:hypothetical protein [Neorhizobium galegae]|uniref:Uncharacterized protein n=2 Tax=Neorhizobium galegae TaxID=399 RepID=A0A068SNE8_NEOGA|nr:hypothetical protein [Neorhizobium galegae]KAB1085989.1 hypothetical protein F4V91_05845 [Neorhizobium galegae]MCQ1850246.1 hypothetical protein [Neorhizobium galegae]CDN47291.1 Hypothetical protein RG540_CH11030 [Neorhizobium galegae bv. orientalis str. HAMBI 540]CDZ47851.1 Hypothetical protein NGAL_HAMBI2427_23980 [Neorhizobium galegae bv. orientalis]